MKWFRFCKNIFAVSLGLSMLVGCSTMQSNFSKGNYGGVLQEYEATKKGENYEGLSAYEQHLVCSSYFETKKYSQFDECYASYYKKFLNKPDGLSSFHGMSNKFMVYRLRLSHIESQIERGRYQQAFDESEEVIAKLDASNAFFSMDIRTLRPAYYALAGLSSALLGDDERAKQCLNKIGNHTFNDKHGEKKQDKVNIYLAMEDYQSAGKILEGADYDGVKKGILVAAGVATLALGNVAGLSGLVAFIAVGESERVKQTVQIRKLFTSAKVHYETGQYAKAQEEYATLLLSPYFKNFGNLYYVALHDLARIKLKNGETDVAIEMFKEAVDVIETQRSSINTEASKIGFVGDKQQVYNALISALFEQGRYGEAFSYVERGKARALVDLLADKRDFGAAGSARGSQVSTLLNDLQSAELLVAASPYSKGKTESKLRSSSTEDIKKKLSETVPELASLVTVSAFKTEDLQRIIPKGETLVEYYYGDDEALYAFIVSSSKVHGVKLAAGNLDTMVRDFREDVQNYQSSAYKKSGQALYAQLIQPIESKVNGNKLTIVPRGVLHYVPFTALPSNNGFMVDHYSVRILPSASVLQFLGKKQKSTGSLLALGNPDLGKAEYDLPFAQDEAVNVASKVKDAKVLLRKEASESAVKNYGVAFKYLHFASHGTFNAEKPLTSGLMLAKDASNDGVLSVGELYDLSLNADLVTLSACETALGKISNGDDVVGFTRGFLYAGASSIISSLWQVDDQATSRLMDSFYGRLGKQDKRESLRLAQLDVKKQYNRHPFFWAAFQLTGSM